MDNITVELDDRTLMCVEGVEVGSLLSEQERETELRPLAALVNNDLVSLSYPLTVNSKVRFLSKDSPHGWRVYRRSLCFLLGKAMSDLYPEAHFAVEHSFGSGLYCSFRAAGATADGISPQHLELFEAHMHELVTRNIPIKRLKISFADAVRRFEQSGQTEKLNLLKYRNPPRVVIHWCDGFSDLAHGPLAPATGVLSRFRLIHYEGGFILHLPEQEDPTKLPPFEDQPHLFSVLKEHKKWGRILGVTTAGRLNEIVSSGEIDEFIRTAEALHDKKLGRIADQICARSDGIRFVLIAGPSSAGKTTFSKRLATHLHVNGLRPVTLSTDDYFVGEGRNPLDENGNPDYEHVEAVDIEIFNNHLVALAGGEKIQVPRFNFAAKQREYRGDTLKIDKDQIVIIEGIHGLNPLLTHKVAPEAKFRVYISALTQLNVDSNNRISTTDDRLMRRIIRDNRYRGHSALETLRMWPAVLRGEKRWIFPFQKEADATFNSALDYELAVMKPVVEPLLMQVKPYDEEYAEARRLTEFLLNFLGTGSRSVPNDSILREYIGGSTFRY
jgi:uridine kinase